MKVRGDFVTNSSSSSFCHLSIKCKPLAEMLENYDRAVRGRGQGEFLQSMGLHADSSREEVWGDWDEYDIFNEQVPESLGDVLSVLCRGVVNESHERMGVLGGAGMKELVGIPVAPLVRAIAEHRDEIEEATEEVFWSVSDTGWGGDSEIRFDQGMYDSESLTRIKQIIAEQKDCAVEEVTDGDFFEYVADCTSMNNYTFTFNRAKDVEKFESDFSLL